MVATRFSSSLMFFCFFFFGDVKEWEASQVETVRKMAGSSRE